MVWSLWTLKPAINNLVVVGDHGMIGVSVQQTVVEDRSTDKKPAFVMVSPHQILLTVNPFSLVYLPHKYNRVTPSHVRTPLPLVHGLSGEVGQTVVPLAKVEQPIDIGSVFAME